MVQCFVPDCNHQSERDNCSAFFRFPSDPKKYRDWVKIIRREDRTQSSNSRVCSCHFPDGKKENGPQLFERNINKLFPTHTAKPKRKRTANFTPSATPSTSRPTGDEHDPMDTSACDTGKIILQAELTNAQTELKRLKEQEEYRKFHYTVKDANDDVICMETGLPNKEIFNIVVTYVKRFQTAINYYNNWKVTSISLEDQIFMTLMKLKQNYTNLHLAQLFNCSTATVSNIVLTFIHVLYKLFYVDLMGTVPSREKNKTSLPGSFYLFGNCRMVIDCTDIEVASPSLMSDQKLTYSTYRGMNSFKVLIGVAPNAVITYVSDLFPGSTSDKAIVSKCGILSHFVAGDLILADKGFLIQDIVPDGVAVNIPPFLTHGKFTENEIRITKTIAKCRIHVERANARLKDFKILRFIPAYLRCHAEKLLKLCASLVNLQYPLIKECKESINYD